MLPYWLLFALFALGAVQANRRLLAVGHSGASLGKANTSLLAAAALVPLLMIGLRYEVGADWYNYLGIFAVIQFQGFWDAILYTEAGYGFLNWISAEMGVEIWLVNLACAALFTGGLVSFARLQPNPWLTIAVAIPYLVIVVAMGYTRQGTAIGCVMFGLAALSRGSFIRFVAWVIFAAMFHRSALIVIPIVGVAYSGNRLQTTLLVLASIVFGYYVVLPAAMESYSASYLTNAYEAQGAGIRVAMNIVPATMFLLFAKRFAPDPVERKVWRMIALTAFICAALYFLLASSTIADRLGLYIIPLQLLVLSRLPHAFGSNGQPSFAYMILALAYSTAVQFVWLNYAGHAWAWLPYSVYPLLSTNSGF